MEPQFASFMGEKKLRAKTRDKQRRMATAANSGDTRNIIEEVPIRPTRLVCHEKYLKVGRKLLAEARSRPRHARFTLA